MRTTVTLDEDISRELERLRRDEGLGTSAALNALARRGLSTGTTPKVEFVQTTSSMGAPRLSLDDIGSVIDTLEGDAAR